MDAAPIDSADSQETFAAYLARYYVARKGFTHGSEAETGEFAAACDFVLIYSDGASFQINAVIDCEAAPERSLGLTGDELRWLGEDYLKSRGGTEWTRLRLDINIFEIGPKMDDPERRARLMAISESSSNVRIASWTLDTRSKAVWTNAGLLNGLFAGRPELEHLLREDRLNASRMQGPLPVAAPGSPFLTYGLLASLAGVFACEIVFALDEYTRILQPSIKTLVAMGGSSWPLIVDKGEWYRSISATFLHVDLLHLLLNGLVLFFAGRLLERAIGHAWFGATYAVAAICGSLMSLALNAANIVSVGASGAIMGIVAAAFVCSFRFPAGPVRARLQTMSMQVLIPSLLPLARATTGHQVDFGAHLGGALGGALMGAVMLWAWPRETMLPKLRSIAAAIAVAWAFGAAFSAVAIVPPYAKALHEHALRALLIPDSEMRRGHEVLTAEADRLVERYPGDPRAHFYRATKLLQSGNLEEAERSLRAALDEKHLVRMLPPAFEDAVRGMLALALVDLGRMDEAKATSQPLCERLHLQPDVLRQSLKSLCE